MKTIIQPYLKQKAKNHPTFRIMFIFGICILLCVIEIISCNKTDWHFEIFESSFSFIRVLFEIFFIWFLMEIKFNFNWAFLFITLVLCTLAICCFFHILCEECFLFGEKYNLTDFPFEVLDFRRFFLIEYNRRHHKQQLELYHKQLVKIQTRLAY